MRVADALALARRLGVDRLDAQLLLAHHLGRTRGWLIAHDDDLLPADAIETLDRDLQQRADGVPLAYLTGAREFRGHPLAVTPAVLVPRPETEHLVDWSLECLHGQTAPAVVDLGTGSGAIAIAIALARPDAQVSATDADPAAIAVARDNARRLGAAVDFAPGSWWQAVAQRRFALAVSNPPYVADGDPHLDALRHEPRAALVAGTDGLDDLRLVVAGAPEHLQPGGWLLLEHGCDQGPAVRAMFARAGFDELQTRCDLAGHERCTGGRRSR